jgi:hypothetical protein
MSARFLRELRIELIGLHAELEKDIRYRRLQRLQALIRLYEVVEEPDEVEPSKEEDATPNTDK